MVRVKAKVRLRWRPEPMFVAKSSDELWVGVKGQSNLVIAGSPRNVFRYSLSVSLTGVGHWMG